MIGKIAEIGLGDYFVYGIVVDEHPDYGIAVKLFKPKFPERVTDLASLKNIAFRTTIYLPVRAIKEKKTNGFIRILDNVQPLFCEINPPVFRQVCPPETDGIVHAWVIINGDQRTRVSKLSLEQAMLPDLLIANQEALRDMFDRNIFPWSDERIKRGPISFTASELKHFVQKVNNERL